MKELFTKNLSLKVIAVLFAAGLWMISININDPYQSKDYSVVVQLQNVNVMTGAGKYVEVVDNSDEITVKVRGSRSVMENFSGLNIQATADLNEINENNQVPIKLTTVKTSGNKIESIRSADTYLTVKVEDIRRVQKRIEVVARNKPADGYILGRTSTEQNALTITGPESAVNTVERAVVNMDMAAATEDVSMLLPVELYDADDKRINDSRLTVSIDEVQCVATILAVKEVPVVFDVKGTEAAGYGFTGEIITTPATVLVAAKNSVLRNVNEIKITEEIDLQNAVENVELTTDIRKYLPENVILGAASFDGQVKGLAKVEKEIKKDIELGVRQIQMAELPEGLKAEIISREETMKLTVVGYESVIDDFSERNMEVKVDFASYMAQEDLRTLEENTYDMELTITLPEGMWMDESIPVKVQVEQR